MTVKICVTVGWFKVPFKDQFIIGKLSPTAQHPRRFQVWFARDTLDEVRKTLNKRCREGWEAVDWNLNPVDPNNPVIS